MQRRKEKGQQRKKQSPRIVSYETWLWPIHARNARQWHVYAKMRCHYANDSIRIKNRIHQAAGNRSRQLEEAIGKLASINRKGWC